MESYQSSPTIAISASRTSRLTRWTSLRRGSHGERRSHLVGVTTAPSVRAASRISAARRHSRTRCSRFAFIRAAEIVRTRPAVSISAYVASRTSPNRAAVNTRNSNASLTAPAAADGRLRTYLDGRRGQVMLLRR